MTGIIVSTPPTVEVPPGNNASNPSSLPAVTYRYAVLNVPQTWTAKQTFPLSNITLQAADVVGLSSSATIDTTNAANITSGTLPAGRLPAFTGDITTAIGTVATVLATVNANIGSWGSATQSAQITINGKGLATAAANVTITPAVGSITGLGTGIATALGVNVGTAGAPVVNGGVLGTPSSGVATNLTGTASGLTAGNVTTNANLTGPITSVGNATSIASQTGTGTKFVVDTSPTLITPTLGAATATSINGNTFTSGTYTLTGTAGKTFTFSNTLTLSGTDASTLAIGVGGTLTGSSSSAIWYDNIPQNSKSAAYTTVLSDAQKHIFHPSADTTARTFTIDSNANVAYPIGTAITFVNQNAAGVVTIAITTDTMRLAGGGTTGNRSLAANGIATALKVTSTEWIISGTGLT